MYIIQIIIVYVIKNELLFSNVSTFLIIVMCMFYIWKIIEEPILKTADSYYIFSKNELYIYLQYVLINNFPTLLQTYV